MLRKSVKFLIQHRKGVKKMKKILVYAICALFLVSTSGIAQAATAVARVQATVGTSTAASISLSSATVDFGNITGSLNTYRFRKPLATDAQVTVTWASIPQYEIRVYTANGVGPTYSDARGFIRSGTAATADRLHLKLWCPNFSANKLIGANGPVLGSIGAATDYLWKGYNLGGAGYDPNNPRNVTFRSNILESTFGQDLNGNGSATDTITASDANPVTLNEGPSLSYTREKDTMLEGTTSTAINTRCLLSWNQSGINAVKNTPQGADLNATFPVCFGVDLMGVRAGTYDSNNNGTTPVTTGQTTMANGVTLEILTY